MVQLASVTQDTTPSLEPSSSINIQPLQIVNMVVLPIYLTRMVYKFTVYTIHASYFQILSDECDRC